MVNKKMATIQFGGFYKKSYADRIALVRDAAQLSAKEVVILKRACAGIEASAENGIAALSLPLGVATHFFVNGRDVLVPMAIEEPSVIAGASFAAKLARPSGGFHVTATAPLMIGQLLVVGLQDLDACVQKIEKVKQKILEVANAVDPVLVSLGGGASDIEINQIKTKRGKFFIVHLLIDVCDAMGANVINSMVEAVAPLLTKTIGGIVRAKIVSNLSVHRKVIARARWDKNVLGADVIEAILDLYEFARVDQFRAVTHNKGIMNGIDAVALATGNDFRALEAGAHGFASFKHPYQPLTHYYLDDEKNLIGELEIPLAVGIVGGTTRSNPVAAVCLKILGVTSAAELACIMGAVGLAQNFAALRALVTDGIQRGHMRLHGKTLALKAGAPEDIVEDVVRQMMNDKRMSFDYAQKLIKGRAK